MIVVITGVAGSGKSTVGRILADRLSWQFHEGDDHHPADNVRKMRAGIPLDDTDRRAWLDSIRALIERLTAAGQNAVIACSALKRAHRDRLRLPGVRFVYLKGDKSLLHERLLRRTGHFFDPALLASQFAALEEPDDALVVDIRAAPEAIAREIAERLRAEG